MKWRKAKGYLVEVTKFGDVRDIFSKKTLSQHITRKGYVGVNLKTDSDEKKVRRVHTLVALAWVGPKPTPKHEVNHKDLDKSNNYYKNLEWITSKGNHIHAVKNGVKFGKLNSIQVKEIIRLRKKGVLLKIIASKFDISAAHVSVITRRKWWKHLHV